MYKAPTEESVLEVLGELERAWSAKYPVETVPNFV